MSNFELDVEVCDIGVSYNFGARCAVIKISGNPWTTKAIYQHRAVKHVTFKLSQAGMRGSGMLNSSGSGSRDGSGTRYMPTQPKLRLRLMNNDPAPSAPIHEIYRFPETWLR